MQRKDERLADVKNKTNQFIVLLECLSTERRIMFSD